MTVEYFSTIKKGKSIKSKIPKRNLTPPKKKRLRKKKFWLYCGDCNRWFTKYEHFSGFSYISKENKITQYLCHSCDIKRFRKMKSKA